MIRRIIIEVDMERLGFADAHRVGGALAALEACAVEGVVEMRTETVKGRGVLRRRRDAKSDDQRRLQPQTAMVLAALQASGRAMSVFEIAAASGIGENSVRGQLGLLVRYQRIEAAPKQGRHKRWVIASRAPAAPAVW